MWPFNLIKNNKIHCYDQSTKILEVVNQHKHDPVTLIYIVNWLTKKYTLGRTIHLLNQPEHDRINFPNIELLPPKLMCFDLMYSDRKCLENQVGLQYSSIIPWAWNKSRMLSALNTIGTKNNPWQFDDSNHNVVFIFPTCHTIVYGGNHSISSGIIKNIDYQFTINRVYDISNCYSQIKFSKNKFSYNNHSVKVSENQIITGVIFEIGRLIFESGFKYNDYLIQYKAKYDPYNSKINDLFYILEDELNKFYLQFDLRKSDFS